MAIVEYLPDQRLKPLDVMFLRNFSPVKDDRRDGSFRHLDRSDLFARMDPLGYLHETARLVDVISGISSVYFSTKRGPLVYKPKNLEIETLLSELLDTEVDVVGRSIYREITLPAADPKRDYPFFREKLDSISDMFIRALEKDPVRGFEALDYLSLWKYFPAFKKFDYDTLRNITRELAEPDIRDQELVDLIEYKFPGFDRVSFFKPNFYRNLVIKDVVMSVAANADAMKARLQQGKRQRFDDLMPQIKTGMTRLIEVLGRYDDMPDGTDEEKLKAIFRLYDDSPSIGENLARLEQEEREDRELVRRCLETAKESGASEPVACLMINNGIPGSELISAVNQLDESGEQQHAEVLAMHEARRRWGEEGSRDITVAVSMQPCSPCISSFIQMGFKVEKLVFGGYTHPGIYSAMIVDDALMNESFSQKVRLDAMSERDLRYIPEVHDGVLALDAEDFYRRELGWTQMVYPASEALYIFPYWTRRYSGLLLGQNP
jgi:tRNA(Arg) A34 adenosine deaminase TadA